MQVFESTEYPSGDRVLEGPRDGELFEYVSADYLNGIVNYVTIKHAWVVGRYHTIATLHEEQARAAERGHHTHLAGLRHDGGLEDVDDVVLVATSHAGTFERVWVFYFDLDVSDCCVGWTSTRTVMEVCGGASAHHPVAAQMDVSKLTGWVSF